MPLGAIANSDQRIRSSKPEKHVLAQIVLDFAFTAGHSPEDVAYSNR